MVGVSGAGEGKFRSARLMVSGQIYALPALAISHAIDYSVLCRMKCSLRVVQLVLLRLLIASQCLAEELFGTIQLRLSVLCRCSRAFFLSMLINLQLADPQFIPTRPCTHCRSVDGRVSSSPQWWPDYFPPRRLKPSRRRSRCVRSPTARLDRGSAAG